MISNIYFPAKFFLSALLFFSYEEETSLQTIILVYLFPFVLIPLLFRKPFNIGSFFKKNNSVTLKNELIKDTNNAPIIGS